MALQTLLVRHGLYLTHAKSAVRQITRNFQTVKYPAIAAVTGGTLFDLPCKTYGAPTRAQDTASGALPFHRQAKQARALPVRVVHRAKG